MQRMRTSTEVPALVANFGAGTGCAGASGVANQSRPDVSCGPLREAAVREQCGDATVDLFPPNSNPQDCWMPLLGNICGPGRGSGGGHGSQLRIIVNNHI